MRGDRDTMASHTADIRNGLTSSHPRGANYVGLSCRRFSASFDTASEGANRESMGLTPRTIPKNQGSLI